MPLAQRERIAADIKRVMDDDPSIGERLTLTAQIVNFGGPAEFAKAIEDQRATLAGIAKELGISAKQ